MRKTLRGQDENSTSYASKKENSDDAPVWTEDDFEHAAHRVGLKPAGKKQADFNEGFIAWSNARKGHGRGRL